jgi:hypothetical protein
MSHISHSSVIAIGGIGIFQLVFQKLRGEVFRVAFEVCVGALEVSVIRDDVLKRPLCDGHFQFRK